MRIDGCHRDLPFRVKWSIACDAIFGTSLCKKSHSRQVLEPKKLTRYWNKPEQISRGNKCISHIPSSAYLPARSCLAVASSTDPAKRELSIHAACKADLPDLAKVERLTHGFWNEEDLRAELKQKHSVLLTARSKTDERETTVGLALMWCLADEAQIVEVAVHPDFRRQGIGLALMQEALAQGQRFVRRNAGRGCALLEVGTGNVAAIALYKKLGFQANGMRKGYYPDGSNAYTMRVRI